MKAILYTSILVLISVLMPSCESDNSPPVAIDSILGEWKVIDAYRNKRQTKLLNKAIVSITDSTFMTDIPPNRGAVRYSYNGNKIILDSDDDIMYKVTGLKNDTMSLITELQEFEFKLILKKQEPADEN